MVWLDWLGVGINLQQTAHGFLKRKVDLDPIVLAVGLGCRIGLGA
jgi:outer membrane protein W